MGLELLVKGPEFLVEYDWVEEGLGDHCSLSFPGTGVTGSEKPLNTVCVNPQGWLPTCSFRTPATSTLCPQLYPEL